MSDIWNFVAPLRALLYVVAVVTLLSLYLASRDRRNGYTTSVNEIADALIAELEMTAIPMRGTELFSALETRGYKLRVARMYVVLDRLVDEGIVKRFEGEHEGTMRRHYALTGTRRRKRRASGSRVTSAPLTGHPTAPAESRTRDEAPV